MSLRRSRLRLAVLGTLLAPAPARGADHNDPNAINSIFADVAVSAADLYDIFGWPGKGAGGEGEAAPARAHGCSFLLNPEVERRG